MENLDYIDINKKIQELVNFQELSFKEIEFFDYHSILQKTDKDFDYRIQYSIFPSKDGSSSIGAFSFGIISNSVNSILKKIQGIIAENNQSIIFNANDYTLYDREGKQNGWELEKEISYSTIIIKRVLIEENLHNSTKLFRKYIDNFILPFFSKITLLQQINDEIIEKYEWLEWSKFISGQVFFKAIIIMKLCKNEKIYNEFTEMYSKRIFEAIKKGEKDLQSYYDFLMVLIAYLDSGEYLKGNLVQEELQNIKQS
jgi:hypothetical protein